MMTLIEVHRLLFERYILIIEESCLHDKQFLVNFCKQGILLENTDKMSRWLGFIQGILFRENLIDLTVERDYSRIYYKPIYESMGYDTTSIEIER